MFTTPIKLCTRRSCCPTIEFNNGVYIIKDDFGGNVKLLKEELDLLIKIVKDANREGVS